MFGNCLCILCLYTTLLLYTVLCDTMFVYYVCILWYVYSVCLFTVQGVLFRIDCRAKQTKFFTKYVEFEQTVTHILFSLFHRNGIGVPAPLTRWTICSPNPNQHVCGDWPQLQRRRGRAPPHNLSPKGGASSASINGYNSQVRVIWSSSYFCVQNGQKPLQGGHLWKEESPFNHDTVLNYPLKWETLL